VKYLVLSTSVVDEIHFADGSVKTDVAGGAGIYALVGMKVWADEVGIVTGVGGDYFRLFGAWYRENGITTDGLTIKDEHTPRTIIRYQPNGERTETPAFGLEHYLALEGRPDELDRHCDGAKGVYVFKSTPPKFWEEMLSLKTKRGFKLMWEINCEATTPENRDVVERIARSVDVLSINFAESKSLLGTDSLEVIVESFHEWRLPMVFLRLGSAGSCAIADGSTTFIPPVPDCPVVDVTGAGNGSSGGVLVGFCETGDAARAAMMGSVSASFCISQHGVPGEIDSHVRGLANRRLKALMEGRQK
jgi:sugar/nucleoside kinase (ribokinase family)